MSLIQSLKLPYRVRCELPDCRKIIQHVHRITIEGNRVTTCSPDHAMLAEERWNEKKNLNIRIGVPPEPEEEMDSGNTDEF